MPERVSFSASGLEKVLRRLEDRITEGRYYEAQQMYKATFHRCKAKQCPEEGFSVLQAGYQLQFQHKQITCGAELLRMLLESFLEECVPVDGDKLQKLLSALALFHTCGDAEISSDEAVLELRRTVGAAVKWCTKCGDRQALRKVFGAAGAAIVALQDWQGLGVASQYFCHSDDSEGFANAVIRSMSMGQPQEVDLFAARAVLQVLAAGRKESMVTQLDLARDVWQRLQKNLRDRLPHSTPLQNFVEFMLTALGKLSQPMFDLLRAQYKPCLLARDEQLWNLVERVGSVYFGRGDADDGGLGGILGKLFG